MNKEIIHRAEERAHVSSVLYRHRDSDSIPGITSSSSTSRVILSNVTGVASDTTHPHTNNKEVTEI